MGIENNVEPSANDAATNESGRFGKNHTMDLNKDVPFSPVEN